MNLPDVPELMTKLDTPDAVFEAWRNRQDDKSWVRLDLSALRIGYELGLRASNHAQPARTNRFTRLVERWRQRYCHHAFAMEDLEISQNAPLKQRARWPCAKCGKVFEGDGGLIAISDGRPATVFRRSERSNPRNPSSPQHATPENRAKQKAYVFLMMNILAVFVAGIVLIGVPTPGMRILFVALLTVNSALLPRSVAATKCVDSNPQ